MLDPQQIATQLRQMGVAEERIPQLVSDVRYHLSEHGTAQIFQMQDGGLQVGSPAAPPRAHNAASLPPQDPTEEPEDAMSRDIALYVDVLAGLENAQSDSLKEKLRRMAGVLERKLEEDVEDYISNTQLKAHKADKARLDKKLAAWKTAVTKGQTTQSFQDWDESLPEL